jgi:hypothetical protein
MEAIYPADFYAVMAFIDASFAEILLYSQGQQSLNT